ncbi:Acetyltransferase (GNAT) family protein [Cognatiyoonia koreensis]|uniref:Acetyltransferase (GNAT) family protein n=1 Tax=Cognatiyoonia koreensis TaxID=364200 RepID=A0A1I0NDT3_9RHOB|nr:GNAT family N-acetyltransferase [Cognatiyoonia koreensis]SEV99127.1 Acetyltransferase (GNAT) family protein [Cognatiyoonia koreensis]
MITIAPLPRQQIAKVAHLILTEPQYPFVGEILDMTAERDPKTDFHCGLRGKTYVGFFKIDHDLSRKLPELAVGSYGFRGLLIGGQYQGLGYGTALLSALPDYLRKTYPKMDTLWLSVDTINTHAIGCYEKTGWTATGLERDGRSGREMIMHLDLSADQSPR